MRIGWMMLVLAGCKSLPNMNDLRKLLPEVRFDDLKVDRIDFDGLDAKVVLDVVNPYPVPLNVADITWKLGLAGHPFLDGTDTEAAIDASATSKVRIPFTLKFAQAFGVFEDSKGKDQLPYSFDTTLGFDTQVVGRVEVPLHREGDLPALHAPKVSLKAVRVESLSLAKQTASLAVNLGLASDQGSALTFDGFHYGLKLAGNDVADGRTEVRPLQDSETVTIPIDVQLLGLGAAAVEAITKKGPVKVRITGGASVGTPFGAVPFDFDEATELTLH